MKPLNKKIVKAFYKDIAKLMRKKYLVPPRVRVLNKSYAVRYYNRDMKRAYLLLRQGYFPTLTSLLRESLGYFLDDWETVLGETK